MNEAFYSILIDADVVSSLIPIFALFLTGNKTRLKLRRVLYYLAVVWALAEFINWVFYLNGKNNLIVVHIYDSLSTIGYYYFFYMVAPAFISRKIFVTLSVSYLVLIWGTIVWTDSYDKSLILSNIITFVIPVILSLCVFYSISKEARIENLLDEPIYWINSAILIHFGFGLCANISLDFIIKSPDLQMNIWPLVLISNLIHNIVFTIGVWKTNRK